MAAPTTIEQYVDSGTMTRAGVAPGFADRGVAKRSRDGEALGTSQGSSFPTYPSLTSSEAGRRARERLRATAGRHTPDHPVGACLRTPKKTRDDAFVDVSVRYSAERGRATFRGLARCGSSWVCPDCAAQKAAENAQRAGQVLAWAREQGFTLCMITLTVRHKGAGVGPVSGKFWAGHSLERVWDAVSAGSHAITGGARWSGETEDAFATRLRQWEIDGLGYKMGYRDRAPRGWKSMTPPQRRVGAAERFGVRGWMRAVEVTIGARGAVVGPDGQVYPRSGNGHHVHTHLIAVLDCPPSEASERAQRLGDWMFDRWGEGIAKEGMTAGRRHGVDVSVAVGAEARLVDYIAKGAFGSEQELRAAIAQPAHKFAAEATMGVHKKAKEGQNRHPLDILDAIGRHERAGTLDSLSARRDIRLWHEYARVSRRRKQLIFSAELRDIARELDEKAADELEAGTDAEDVLVLSPPQWALLVAHSIHAPSDLLTMVERAGGAVDDALAWLKSIGVTARAPVVALSP